MTIEITDEIVAVAQEFVMSKYATQQALREAMLQEIVILRKENEHLRNEIVCLQQTVDSLDDEVESMCAQMAGDDW